MDFTADIYNYYADTAARLLEDEPIELLSGDGSALIRRSSVGVLLGITMCAVIAYLRELLEGSATELRELAGSDPLTEVGNYRLLHERLNSELSRHDRDEGAA